MMMPNRYCKVQLERAIHFNDISNQLIDSGDRWGALAAIKKSADLFREVAAVAPDAANRCVGMTLKKMARYLLAEGRGKEAVDAIQEAVDVYRVQAKKEPEAIIPDLAAALCDLTLHVSEADPEQTERAFAAGQEAVSLYRQLAATNPDEYKKDLALALNNVSNRFYLMGDKEAALASITESLEIYNELAVTKPIAYNHKVADGLFNMSSYLATLGRKEEALATMEEATDMHRAMAIVNPDGFNDDLALSLRMLSSRLKEIGRKDDALVALQKAAEINRNMAAKNPAKYNPKLAESLQAVAISLGDTSGGQDAARTTINEVVEIYKRLYKQDPKRFRPAFEGALNILKRMGPEKKEDTTMPTVL